MAAARGGEITMPRLKLNEDMVRRIETALDERKQQRRQGTQPHENPTERRGKAGRRESDRDPPAR